MRISDWSSDVGSSDLAAGPDAVLVVELVERTVVAAGNYGEGALIGADVVEVDADGQRTVVRVRPVLDVLVPLHLLAALRPFEVQLAAMELHVGTDEVCRQDRTNTRLKSST